MFLMTANTVVIGWALELFIFGIIFSFYRIVLITEHTAPLLLLGIFATFNIAIVSRLRKYGVANLNFELHERALNALVIPPASWGDPIRSLLDETSERSNELEMLVRHIDEAPGAVERQDRRAEAKAWLKLNHDQLNAEDQEFVRERLGYLHL